MKFILLSHIKFFSVLKLSSDQFTYKFQFDLQTLRPHLAQSNTYVKQFRSTQSPDRFSTSQLFQELVFVPTVSALFPHFPRFFRAAHTRAFSVGSRSGCEGRTGSILEVQILINYVFFTLEMMNKWTMTIKNLKRLGAVIAKRSLLCFM